MLILLLLLLLLLLCSLKIKHLYDDLIIVYCYLSLYYLSKTRNAGCLRRKFIKTLPRTRQY